MADWEARKKDLADAALKARKNSYAPYSHWTVGAALLDERGNVYTGCNIENGAYSPSCCAERVAFFTALAAGSRNFKAIAIAGGPEKEKPKQYCPPCGVCRQVMTEFCEDTFRILLVKGDGQIEARTLGELLPQRFTLSDTVSENLEEREDSHENV